MNCQPTAIPEVLLFKPTLHCDERGFFMETFRQNEFDACLTANGMMPTQLVQDNVSRSQRHVLRGLHFQSKQPQGKLVRVSHGEIFDVAVDIRPQSATLGHWVGHIISAENRLQMWIPPGFAHGFYVLSDIADIVYKCSDYYQSDDEQVIAWNDPQLAIDWPLKGEPILSIKDNPQFFSQTTPSSPMMQKIK
ncbi:dTDP-4-dehydrorhamnose 3,5-epimerase [Shewanella sp.]|uniref:dTDP-4-dehydrorhamnose 3,5-epimerase n=1 Tax=Shewanella sp. TaxID=50422 RepID=UPI00405481D8